jgi:hypothetical protein
MILLVFSNFPLTASSCKIPVVSQPSTPWGDYSSREQAGTLQFVTISTSNAAKSRYCRICTFVDIWLPRYLVDSVCDTFINFVRVCSTLEIWKQVAHGSAAQTIFGYRHLAIEFSCSIKIAKKKIRLQFLHKPLFICNATQLDSQQLMIHQVILKRNGTETSIL